MSNHYKTLGVKEDAEGKDIKKAYRKLSREYHPDLNPDNPEAEDRFKEISEAYTILSDSQKRQEYDMQRSGGMRPPPGMPFGFAGGSRVPFDLQDMFADFFGSPMPHRGTQRPPQPRRSTPPGERYISFKIPFKKLKRGDEVDMNFKMLEEEICVACGGVGGERSEECEACEGAGMVTEMLQQLNVYMTSSHPCDACNREGRIIENRCEHCSGQGVVNKERKYQVKLRCKELKQ